MLVSEPMWGHRYILALALALGAASCGDNRAGGIVPTVDGLTLTIEEDTPITRILDITGDADLTITLGDPAHGTVTMDGGSFTYTPDANYHGPDSFTVTVADGPLEDSATVDLTVRSINDAPAGVADAFATTEDVAHAIAITSLLANDVDVDGDTLTIIAVGNATSGSVFIAGPDIVFVPHANFAGTGTYRYTASDGTATSNVTVTVTVGGVNDAPVAIDDARTTPEDTALVVTAASLTANDVDADNQTPTMTAVSNPSGGTVALVGGTVTFTPTANFNGAASFGYTVSDGQDTDTGTVVVTVTPVNDAPVATNDDVTTNADVAVTVTQAAMLANDTDVENQPLTVTAANNAVNGTITFTNGDVTFTPTAGFTGTGSYEYTVSDGTDASTGTVTITIAAVTAPRSPYFAW